MGWSTLVELLEAMTVKPAPLTNRPISVSIPKYSPSSEKVVSIIDPEPGGMVHTPVFSIWVLLVLLSLLFELSFMFNKDPTKLNVTDSRGPALKMYHLVSSSGLALNVSASLLRVNNASSPIVGKYLCAIPFVNIRSG